MNYYKQLKGAIEPYMKYIVLVAPLFFLFLPADYFDYGESLCPSKRLLDMECLGCGMTRATQHSIHLDFKTAWEYNKLFVVVVPAIIYYWAKYIYYSFFSK